MEDAHTTVLDLDDAEHNAFFAVYDGHGGVSGTCPYLIFEWGADFLSRTGGSVAKYAGQHVHQRLVSEEAYTEKDYPTAFKKAFLGTDDDLRAGSPPCCNKRLSTGVTFPILALQTHHTCTILLGVPRSLHS
jgi:protein phosphatase 2C family protein 2/3